MPALTVTPETGAGIATCTIIGLNPATGAWHVFAQVNKDTTNVAFVDGLYFNPTAQ